MGKINPPSIPRPMVTFNLKPTFTSSGITLTPSIEEIHRKALASLTNSEEEKTEKPFILPNENFESVDFSSMGVIHEDTTVVPSFIEGEKYSLQGVSCEGFSMPNKTYKLIGVVNNFHGVDVDYVIMKQIDGKKDQIFTFSKNDCNHLGIEYQDGLQPFPKTMPWKHVKEKIEFNKDDLSTTPRSEIDNTIRYILLKLNGFKDYSDGYILSPSGKLVTESSFKKSLIVINNEPIVFDGHFKIKEKTKLNARLVYPQGLTYNHGNFISKDDSIYLLITLITKAPYSSTFDRCFGVEPKYLQNIKPQDLFTIAWDEFACFTIEEYNKFKEESKKKALERVKKAEALRLKKLAEEREKKEAFKRLSNRSWDIPLIPQFNFKAANAATVSIYTDAMTKYFKELDDSLNMIGNALNDCGYTKRRPSHIHETYLNLLNE